MNLKNIVILTSLVAFPSLLYAEDSKQILYVDGDGEAIDVSATKTDDGKVTVEKRVYTSEGQAASYTTLDESDGTVTKSVSVDDRSDHYQSYESPTVTVDANIAAKRKINKKASKVAANKN